MHKTRVPSRTGDELFTLAPNAFRSSVWTLPHDICLGPKILSFAPVFLLKNLGTPGVKTNEAQTG
jgi:hypothetical protein